MKTLFNYGCTVPTAFVTRGRQRVKQYNKDTVYLNNGDEFEVELFNPTTNKVLAVIELNGITIGNAGIVLRPGERVFLERYLNEARKFLFETYEVDKNNKDVMRAIVNNGKVEVKFYCEQISFNNFSLGSSWSQTTTWPTSGNPTYTSSHTGEVNRNVGNADSLMYLSCDFNHPTAGPIQANLGNSRSFNKSMETGRVEKGSNSNQSFVHDSTSFNMWWSWKTEWKILPHSQKPIMKEDIKIYCSSCGKKRRKSEIYCSVCGSKY